MSENTFKSYGAAIGQLIVKKRKILGLTQAQLSEDAFGTPSKIRRISDLENGRVANPHQKTIDPIIVTLKISEEEIAQCVEKSPAAAEPELLRLSGEAEILLEALLHQFEHTDPDAGLVEIHEFLRARAKEWRNLKRQIEDIDAPNKAISDLKKAANEALANAEFTKADEFLAKVEKLQLRETIEQVWGLAKIRVSRGDVLLLKNDGEGALKLYLGAARLFIEVDTKEMVGFLDSQAHKIYEFSRRALDPHFAVAVQLLETAVDVESVHNSSEISASLKSKLAMMCRNQSLFEDGEQKQYLLERSIQLSKDVFNETDPKQDLETWASTQIILGNSYLEKWKIQNNVKRIDNLDCALTAFQKVIDFPTIEKNHPVILCTAYNSFGLAAMLKNRHSNEADYDTALNAYNKSLVLSAANGMIDEWAAAQSNIGQLFASKAERAKTKDAQEFFRIQSIASHLAALEVYPASFFPTQSAQVNVSLAYVFLKHAVSLNSELTEHYLFRSLASYRAAAVVFTEERYPNQWAGIQRHMGMVFTLHAELEGARNTALDYQEALLHFQNALKVFSDNKVGDDYKMCSEAATILREKLKEIS